MIPKLIDTTERAIAALHRHGYTEASACLSIELLLFKRHSVSADRLRRTANNLLRVLS